MELVLAEAAAESRPDMLSGSILMGFGCLFLLLNMRWHEGLKEYFPSLCFWGINPVGWPASKASCVFCGLLAVLLGISLVYRGGGFSILAPLVKAMEGKSDLVFIAAIGLALIFAWKDFAIHQRTRSNS